MEQKKDELKHKKRHIELHNALDELFADYINHHPNETQFTEMPLMKLLAWSNEQTKNPTEEIDKLNEQNT